MTLPNALAPGLLATGMERTDEFVFEYGNNSVEFHLDDLDNRWWIVIVIDDTLRSESKVVSPRQALRLLWTFDMVTLTEEAPVLADVEA